VGNFEINIKYWELMKKDRWCLFELIVCLLDFFFLFLNWILQRLITRIFWDSNEQQTLLKVQSCCMFKIEFEFST